eukprot:8953765-Pyramimonas_sp.AAC.1
MKKTGAIWWPPGAICGHYWKQLGLSWAALGALPGLSCSHESFASPRGAILGAILKNGDQLVDRILDAKAKKDRGELFAQSFHNLQQLSGLTYDEHSIVFDASYRPYIDAVKHTMEDWMHIIVASGGMGQYVTNCWLLTCFGAGYTSADLDRFQMEIRWPSNRQRLHGEFFKKRTSAWGGHLKCFAAEVMQAVQ